MRFLRRKNLILLFLLLMTVLVMGIGYSAINSVTGEIKGTLVANSQQGVFITNVTYVSNVDAQLGNCQIGSFLGTTMKSRVELSSTNASSSVTYRVTVYNAYATEAKFTEVVYDNDFYDNQNITFEISGFKQGDIIESKATKDITVTFKYKSSTVPSNKVLNSYLNFKIEKINRLMVARVDYSSNSVYLRSSVAKNKIESIQFKKGTDIPETATNTFDASESQDNSIIGYYTDTDNNELYELTFISEDDIYANKNSQYLFNYLTNLKTIEFDNFDTSQVTSMSDMFSYSNALTTLDVSKFDTSKVTSMERMFSDCDALTTLDLSKFDTSQVTSMEWMFSYCDALTTLDLSKFDTSQVTSMESMFYNCNKLTTLDVSKFDTSQVTSMESMFSNCNALTTLDLSKFDTSKVTSMENMFRECKALTTLDVSKFDTSQVTSMGSMFFRCSKLTTLDVSKFNTSKVTSMEHMFRECKALTTLDVSKFDTSQVTSMYTMFYYCSKLITLDVSKFDTSKVTSMGSMFSGCDALTTLDVSKFDTSKVTSMGSMFTSCSKLTTLDVSKFDTSKVTNMSYMFSYCYALTTLDVSKFDTSQVTNMARMFAGCSSLETIYVSEYDSTTGKGWTTSAVTNSSYMFNGCNKIVGSNGTTYDSTKVDATYARIDKTDAPGYFSEKLVYLPTGFTHVAGTTFKSGFAIQDSKGNQYVWVEVPKTAEVYPTAGLSITAFTKSEYTAIETDLHTYTNDYRKGTRYKDEYYSDATTGLTSDQYYELKNKMLKSVYQNGGFYVGKYETGIEGAPKTSFEITPTETPVIKQNAYPYNYVTCSQAQTLANSMESGSYNSSLMFGVQWDLVLKYLETKGTSQADLKTNSTSWGNYEDNLWNITNADSKYSTDYSSGWISGAYGEKEDEEEENSGILLSTGASDTFSKQGIYDLAGNVDEWTLEYTSNSSAPYVIRGGSCFLNGSVGPAAYRYNYRTTSYDKGIGFRVALY